MGSTGFLYECREATGFVRLDNIIRGEKFIKIGLYKNLISEADYNKLLDKHYAIYVEYLLTFIGFITLSFTTFLL